ncbi:ABC transporter substrate-binding protein [Streptomyces sp. NPDC088090]|uniref:ABC transporter substrate-binding protein n=1 Tax=Streptomyces sp. NPDC088090 TaxID=3365822 RepID=UPI00385124AF
MQALDGSDPRQVGRYRILARLGAGGMGRVYLGRSTSGRMVAVKVVRAELAEDPEFQRRFVREVEAARRVTGFFTAAVVDADPLGSPPWLATAYVPGLPLETAVRTHGAWPRRSLLYLGAGLVEALEAIHGTGLIHRDLKPSNVLIAPDGPRVIDFGISIIAESNVLTQAGMVIGTPGFMSPEQVAGSAVGPASDVFSLGAVLAFAATGTGPFGTGSAHSVNFRAVYGEPDLRLLPPGTDLIARCLEKDPARRPTVPQLLAEFAGLLGEGSGHTYGGGPAKETHWLPEAVAAALGEAGGALGPVAGPGPASPPTPAPGPAPASTPTPTPGSAPTGWSSTAPAGFGAGTAPGHREAPSEGPGSAGHPAGAVPRPDPRVPLAKGPAAPPAMPATPPPAMPATPPAAPPDFAVRPPAGPPAAGNPYAVTAPAGYPPGPGGAPARPSGRPRGRRLVAIALGVALVAGGGVTAVVLSQKDDPAGKGRTQGQGKDDGKDQGEGKTRDDGSAGSPGGFNAAVGKVVNASDKKGGTLRLASMMDADSWDPARSYSGWVWSIQRLYSRTLMTYAPEPGEKGLSVVPDLAAAQPQVSSDGRTYTFRLRPGLKFEDGTPITAADVKYGIERAFAPEIVGGPTYLVDVLDQKQNYQGPYKDTGTSGLRSVEAPDDLTLVFRLAEADSRFPYLLTMGATAPVPRKRDSAARYGTRPMSSGPYRFSSYQPDRSLVLVRNEQWDPATDPLRKALPDRVELTILPDQAKVDEQLLAGTADLDASQTGMTQENAVRTLADPKRKADLDNPYSGYLRMAAMISDTAPLDNVNCRKAVVYAAGTKTLRAARGGDSFTSPQGNMLPPTVRGADSYDPFGLTGGEPRREEAEKALRACGKPGGFTTKIALNAANTKDAEVVTALQNDLKAVGITLETERFDNVTAYFAALGSPKIQREKGIGMLMMGWGADFPTGAGFLQPLADGGLTRVEGNNNYARVNDPRINELFDRASAETDDAAATRLYQEINHRVTDGAYYLPVSAEKTVAYRGPRLTNVYVHEAFNLIDVQALGIDETS